MSLSKPEYKKRLIDETLKKYLNTFGAVSIEGPKWCGKTWTSLNQANTEYALDNDDIREAAIIDNDYVLNGKYPILIDEWNYVPKL